MEITNEIQKLRIIVENFYPIFSSELSKMKKYTNENKEEFALLSSKFDQKTKKIKNNFDQHELLFVEIKSIKDNLMSISEKITNSTFQKIFSIKNPNEIIYLLMKKLYHIIRYNNEDNDKNISWEEIKTNLNYKDYETYVQILNDLNINDINEDNDNLLNRGNLDESKPFLENYENLKEILSKFSKELPKILDFVKFNESFLIKMKWLKNNYIEIINKKNKITELNVKLSNFDFFLQKSEACIINMEQEIKMIDKQPIRLRNYNSHYFGFNIDSKSHQEKKKIALNLIKCYKIDERYNIFIENKPNSKMKYIFKLKPEFKDRNTFIYEILESKEKYDSNEESNFDESIVSEVLNEDKEKSTIHKKTVTSESISTMNNLLSYNSTGYKESGGGQSGQEEENNMINQTDEFSTFNQPLKSRNKKNMLFNSETFGKSNEFSSNKPNTISNDESPNKINMDSIENSDENFNFTVEHKNYQNKFKTMTDVNKNNKIKKLYHFHNLPSHKKNNQFLKSIQISTKKKEMKLDNENVKPFNYFCMK